MIVAKRLGMIAAVGPVIDQLRLEGLFVSEGLARQVLKVAGE